MCEALTPRSCASTRRSAPHNPFNYLSPPLTCVRWRVCSGSKRPQNLGSIRPPLRPAFG